MIDFSWYAFENKSSEALPMRFGTCSHRIQTILSKTIPLLSEASSGPSSEPSSENQRVLQNMVH
jgi:hypothetical protein